MKCPLCDSRGLFRGGRRLRSVSPQVLSQSATDGNLDCAKKVFDLSFPKAILVSLTGKIAWRKLENLTRWNSL